MIPLTIKPNEELGEESRLEKLLVEISTLFINLPVEQIDNEISNAQHRICDFLNIDRSSLWQTVNQQPGTMALTHFCQPQDIAPPPDNLDLKDFWPWSLQKVMNGETFSISKMSDLPAEAKRDRESFDYFGAKSGVYVPLSVGLGPVFGVLTFALVREERDWSDRVVNDFTLFAQVFANALARKKAEMVLRESEARLILTTNAAGAGLWNMELDTGLVWGSDKIRDLYHFAPDELLTNESFFRAIHPEDRERVNQVVQQVHLAGETFSCEFRVILPDGEVRWIAARGQRHTGGSNGSDRLLGVSLDISTNKQMELQLEEQLSEIQDLKQRLEQENLYLQEEIKSLAEHSEILGRSVAIKQVIAQARQVAETDSTVLILGETGTGKELLARAIHQMSLRKDRPLITINCASLPPTLIENELFGREKGAYTGALTKMIGRFELANGSTLFLDEIGELPFDLQSKLLRVLEEGQLERLGSTTPLYTDVRIIAATNRDIEHEVRDGKFRQDLFYRLNVFPILIPPLSDRIDDIPILVRAFSRAFELKLGKQIEKIPHRTMQALMSYQWPGNVRELRNIIERGMILTKDKTLVVELPKNATAETDVTSNLDDIIRREILAVLKQTRWRIAGKDGAAEILGLKRSTLYSKMKKLGIQLTSP